MMWKVTGTLLHFGLYEGEPFAVFRDEEGDLMLLTRQQVETPADPTKATEVIGTLAEMPN